MNLSPRSNIGDKSFSINTTSDKVISFHLLRSLESSSFAHVIASLSESKKLQLLLGQLPKLSEHLKFKLYCIIFSLVNV